MEVNETGEIVVLMNMENTYLLRRMNQTGTVLHDIRLNLDNDMPKNFIIQGTRYFMCTDYKILGVNEDASFFFKMQSKK